MIGFDEYQKVAAETAIYRRKINGSADLVRILGLTYTALGLNGEAGEVAEQVKKMIRDGNGILDEERKEKLLLELGDVMWYLSACCTELGVNLSTVANMNLEKLKKRYYGPTNG